MMQANLALSGNPQAAFLAQKQEETAATEAQAKLTELNGHAPMSPAMRQRLFQSG